MSSVLANERVTTTQKFAVQLPDGRHRIVALCLGDAEPIIVEKRGESAALKIRGEWFTIRPDGSFRAQMNHEAEDRLTSHELTGRTQFFDGELTIDALENMPNGEFRHWHGNASIRMPIVRLETRPRKIIVLRGTAKFSFLDGPTVTPLEAEVEIVSNLTGRAIVLPPALTFNRGRVEIPIENGGHFSRVDKSDGPSFHVRGQVTDTTVLMTIEAAGSIGWTLKELTGEIAP